MVCLQCSSETQVINSRPQKRTNQVWRRRRCILCDSVFSTQEVPDYSKSIVVGDPANATRRQQLAAFERDKLLVSIYKSLTHRSDPLRDAGGLCATIITKVAATAHNGVVDRQIIIQTTIVALTRFDTLAAQHYQAMHKY